MYKIWISPYLLYEEARNSSNPHWVFKRFQSLHIGFSMITRACTGPSLAYASWSREALCVFKIIYWSALSISFKYVKLIADYQDEIVSLSISTYFFVGSISVAVDFDSIPKVRLKLPFWFCKDQNRCDVNIIWDWQNEIWFL